MIFETDEEIVVSYGHTLPVSVGIKPAMFLREGVFLLDYIHKLDHERDMDQDNETTYFPFDEIDTLDLQLSETEIKVIDI